MSRFPIISACEHPTKPGFAILKQTRFSKQPLTEKDTEIWPIPLKYQTQEGVKACLMEAAEMYIPYKGFIKLNAGILIQIN